MGYTTEFEGDFVFNKPLESHHVEYLNLFYQTDREVKRIKKNESVKAKKLREKCGLPFGTFGQYSVCETNIAKECGLRPYAYGKSIIPGQPSSSCQWILNSAGTAIMWDSGEKFYDYIEWIEFIVKHFIKPWGYKLNGSVFWKGEDKSDRGQIDIINNKITITENDSDSE